MAVALDGPTLKAGSFPHSDAPAGGLPTPPAADREPRADRTVRYIIVRGAAPEAEEDHLVQTGPPSGPHSVAAGGPRQGGELYRAHGLHPISPMPVSGAGVSF